MKGWYKALEDLVWLTQLGLNMLLPLVMCLGGAWTKSISIGIEKSTGKHDNIREPTAPKEKL